MKTVTSIIIDGARGFLMIIGFIGVIAFAVFVLLLLPGFLVAAHWGSFNLPTWTHVLITILGVIYTFFVYGYLERL